MNEYEVLVSLAVVVFASSLCTLMFYTGFYFGMKWGAWKKSRRRRTDMTWVCDVARAALEDK